MANDIYNLDLDMDKTIDKSEFLTEVIDGIQNILDAEFPDNQAKRRIKKYPSRINCACPFCGDSASDSYKKRGNLILDGRYKNTYKCHNCGIAMPLDKFFSHFNNNISIGAISYIAANRSDTTYLTDSAISSYLFDIDYIDSIAITREELKNHYHLYECNDIMGIPALNYLKKRLQYKYEKFLYSESERLLYILNLTPSGNVIGYQTRPILNKIPGYVQKYKSYCITKIRGAMGLVFDDIDPVVDALSMLFNVLLVDYNKPVIVLEGPLDSFLLKNSIATCGSTKHMPLEFDFLYMYDSDKPGLVKAIEALGEHKKVFMWKRFISDFELPYKPKWDWNDVVKHFYVNNIRLPRLASYFTNNEFDLMEI